MRDIDFTKLVELFEIILARTSFEIIENYGTNLIVYQNTWLTKFENYTIRVTLYEEKIIITLDYPHVTFKSKSIPIFLNLIDNYDSYKMNLISSYIYFSALDLIAISKKIESKN